MDQVHFAPSGFDYVQLPPSKEQRVVDTPPERMMYILLPHATDLRLPQLLPRCCVDHRLKCLGTPSLSCHRRFHPSSPLRAHGRLLGGAPPQSPGPRGGAGHRRCPTHAVAHPHRPASIGAAGMASDVHFEGEVDGTGICYYLVNFFYVFLLKYFNDKYVLQ